MGKSTISMTIFNSYVSSPEGTSAGSQLQNPIRSGWDHVFIASDFGPHQASIVRAEAQHETEAPGCAGRRTQHGAVEGEWGSGGSYPVISKFLYLMNI